MRTVSVDVNTTGGAGVATGTAQVGVGGTVSTLKGVLVDYEATAPATTVVTITNLGRNLLVTPASNTDRFWALKEQSYDPTGTAIAGQNGYDYLVVHGTISVAVATSNALSPAVSVVLVLDDDAS